MTKASSRIQIGARLPPDLVDELRKSAERNGRTLSAETETALREYLEGQSGAELPQELIRVIESWYKKQEQGQR